MGRYYDDPEKVWTGGPISDENTANYDLRSGISGWAIKAFEIAKAETTAPVDSDDGVVAEIDLIDTGDMTKRSENEAAYKEKAQGLSSPDEEEKVEAINRETELIAWKSAPKRPKSLRKTNILPIRSGERHKRAFRFGATRRTSITSILTANTTILKNILPLCSSIRCR